MNTHHHRIFVGLIRLVYLILAPFVLFLMLTLVSYESAFADGWIYGAISAVDGWIILAIFTFAFLVVRARFPDDHFFR